jgi:hypothetical protein
VATWVTAVAVLFALTGSEGVDAVMLAVLMMLPGTAGAVATIDRAVDAPFAKELTVQVTVCPAAVQPADAETNTDPVGRSSTTVMAVAVAGPLLTTVMV